MVWSRCGRRLFLHPSISCSTSRSVRYSRVLTSAFLGLRGVTLRILAFGDTTRRVAFVMVCRAPLCSGFCNMLKTRKVGNGYLLDKARSRATKRPRHGDRGQTRQGSLGGA